jgi:hypothetical protein
LVAVGYRHLPRLALYNAVILGHPVLLIKIAVRDRTCSIEFTVVPGSVAGAGLPGLIFAPSRLVAATTEGCVPKLGITV